MNVYHLYSLRIRSQWRLPYPLATDGTGDLVDLFEGAPELFASAAEQTNQLASTTASFRHNRLKNGADYLEWPGLFEFVISTDGRRIAARFSNDAKTESFHTYLLGQVFSFALLRQRIEPLHATAVVWDGKAVAFLGDSGYGKSSLGAAFMQAGATLLTDDLLVAKETDGWVLAYPGPPRIKLYPETAHKLLGEKATGVPMNNATNKLVIPVDRGHAAQAPMPLTAFFRLRPPSMRPTSDRVAIRKRSQRQACLDLIANTYNTRISTPERLCSQFQAASRLAASVPIKALSYPRELSRLPDVVDAIVADLAK